jgi:2-oxoglutarate dehydrogenase E2 component (dihydrolipoamide succinyltransferase)
MPVNIVVPEVGESIVDARVARWLKKAGDAVAAGEPVVELETDKVDVEVAPASSRRSRMATGRTSRSAMCSGRSVRARSGEVRE